MCPRGESIDTMNEYCLRSKVFGCSGSSLYRGSLIANEQLAVLNVVLTGAGPGQSSSQPGAVQYAKLWRIDGIR